jgi:hypothetical protein
MPVSGHTGAGATVVVVANSVVELSGTVPSVVAGRVSMAMVSAAVGELLSEPPPQAARSNPVARRATGSARRVTDRAELDLEERMSKVWQTITDNWRRAGVTGIALGRCTW